MFINPNIIVRARVHAGVIALAIYRRPFAYAPRFLSNLELSRSVSLGDRADVVVEQNEAKTASSLRVQHVGHGATDVLNEQDVAEIGLHAPDLRALRRDLARQMTGGSSIGRWIVRGLAVLGVFYVVTTIAMGPRQKTQWAEPQGAASQPAQAPVAVAGTLSTPAQPAPESPEGRALSSVALASDAVALPRVTLEEALSKSSGLPLRAAAPGSPTVIVWSDPLCPHCRDLEAKLDALPQTVGVTIVPVSFRPGSKLVVANIACGATPAEQVLRWTSWMANKPEGDFKQTCDRGPLVADQNSVLMVRAGQLATPTLVTMRGGQLVAFQGNVDELTPESLLAWVTKS